MRVIKNNYDTKEETETVCPNCESILIYTEDDIDETGCIKCPCCYEYIQITTNWIDLTKEEAKEVEDFIEEILPTLSPGEYYYRHSGDLFVTIFTHTDNSEYEVYVAKNPMFSLRDKND